MAEPTTPAFSQVRDFAAAIGRAALGLDLEVIDQALVEADRALTLGPVLDPTLARDGGAALQEQVRLIQAFRTFRAALQEFRPAPVATPEGQSG